MKIIYTLYFILYSLYSFSQFNVIVEDSLREHIYHTTIIKDNEDYILINGSANATRGVCFTKTDTTGNILFNKLYEKPNEYWYELDNIENYQSNNIMLVGKEINFKRYSSLMIFDNNCDTLFTKNFKFETTDTSNVSLYYISKLNNSYYLTGQHKISDDTIFSIIVKIDNNLDTIWTKNFRNGSSEYIGKKTIITYDTSIISIGHIFTGSAIYKQDWYIVKTDSLGNLDWWKHPGNPTLNDGSAADIIQTKDSCFVVVGGKAVYRDAGGTKFDGRIMKFDIEGNIIWDTTYRKRLYNNPDTVYCFFNSIIELDDGGFAVLATEQQDLGGVNNHSVLYRFNAEGDTLWTREYCARCAYANDGQDITGSEYPSTIQRIENGGFLLGGWGYFDYTFDHPYTQQMFLIKTDSLGCDGTLFSCPDTGVYVSEIAEQEGFLVWPNPATNTLNINAKHLAGAMHFQNKEVFIYDVFGRVVRVIASEAWQSVKTDSHGQSPRYDVLNIDVSTLPKGIYFIKIGNLTKKFVKL